jgi:hypothetical protein
MKKMLLLTACCFGAAQLYAQFVHKIKADSVLITNDSCTAELNLESSTKHIKGFLYNYGNGRTRFQKGLIKINDSLYVSGNDTINIGVGINKLIAANGLTKLNDSIKLGGDLLDHTNINLQQKRMRFYLSDPSYSNTSAGGVTITGARGTGGGSDPLYVQTFNRPAGAFSGTSVFAETFWQPTAAVPAGGYNNYISVHKSDYANIDMNGLTMYDFRTIFYVNNTNQNYGNRYHFYAGGPLGYDPIMNNHIGLYISPLKRPTTAHAYAIYTAGAEDSVYNAGPVRWPKYKNNVAEDSVLTTDANGNLKLKFFSAGGVGSYIENQTAIDQSASFRISGSGLIKGGISSTLNVGTRNERFGAGALNSLTVSSNDNTAIGYNALNLYNQISGGNTAIGSFALEKYNNTGLEGITAIGAYALQNFVGNTYDNTAIGYKALQGVSGSNGIENIAIGNSALKENSTGSGNVALGSHALGVNNTGYNNLAVGTYCLPSNTDGFMNTAIGYSVMSSNTSGTYNNALGAHALDYTSTGSGNTALGTHALYLNTTGNYNVAVGGSALHIGNNLNNNTAIGVLSGYANNGSGNIFVGYQSGYNESGSNKLYIENSSSSAPLIYGDFANDTVRINGKFHANGPAIVSTIPFLAGRDTVITYDPVTKQLLATKITTGGGGGSPGGSNGQVQFNNSGAFGGSPNFFWDNTNNRLGIAASSPQYKLDINGDARISTLPFLAGRDTVLTYDPSTKQMMVTKINAGPSSVKLTSDLTAYTSTTLTDATGLGFSVNANTYYHFRFLIVFSSAATTTGIRLSVSAPASPAVFSATAGIPVAGDGAGGQLQGWITASNDAVIGTGVQAINTNYIAIVEGTILTGASGGTLQLRYGSEVAGSGVTIKRASLGQLTVY